MKVSSISLNENSEQRRNSFIKYVNTFMSKPKHSDVDIATKKSNEANDKTQKMGIETLENFTIFPKEVKDGKTIITC